MKYENMYFWILSGKSRKRIEHISHVAYKFVFFIICNIFETIFILQHCIKIYKDMKKCLDSRTVKHVLE